MTNNSIFTRVLALVLCFIMVAGMMTSCFQEPESSEGTTTTTPETSTTTTTTHGTTTNPTEDTTTTNPPATTEPEEDVTTTTPPTTTQPEPEEDETTTTTTPPATTEPEEDVTTTTPPTTTQPEPEEDVTTTTPSTTTQPEEDEEPEEDPVDPNELYSGQTMLENSDLIYGTLANDVFIGGETDILALIPADVKVEMGASSLSLSVKKVEDEALADALSNLDVHVSGIALDNTVPMTVKLGAILPAGLANTELKLYHNENGTPVLMTRVASVSDFAIHNQYVYDSETGNVTIYVSSFSVFTAVQTSASKWDENTVADTSWYNENDTEFTLEDVADFLGFRDLVDGTAIINDETVQDSFAGKTVKLGVDIDLDNKLFNPIGYGYTIDTYTKGNDANTAFMGTFDGGNHTIYNLYQNGWELGYDYSTAGGGLFASIEGSKESPVVIKNLVMSGADIVMECIDMGIVVGYAQGVCHFENIVVTDSTIANYNRATGAVVGEVCYGPYGTDVEKGYSHTFENIIVDSSVVVSSLWGSFDTLIGGVIGGKWGDATVKMTNVITAAELDVYSDVTAAYQWYAYRRCGMLIGHTEQNSPKKALNAAAEFLTCVNVNVYYGDWINYEYYEFENQDNDTGKRYPWVRAQVSPVGNNGAFSNPRYGVPTHNGVKVTEDSNMETLKTDYTPIVFNQLYGGGQGVYGTNEHAGVTIHNDLASAKTVYIKNNIGWTNLKVQCWFKNGDDTWTTNIDGIDMSSMLSNGVYTLVLPAYVYGFKIVADGGWVSNEFIVSELNEKETYEISTNQKAVTKVNGKEYPSLQDAINNANGETVTVIEDITLPGSVEITGNVTLDLNGNKITADYTAVPNSEGKTIVEVLLVKDGANVTITGNGIMIANGDGEYVQVISAVDGATVTIENGTFTSTGCTAIYATRGATVTIYGGTFTAEEKYEGKYYTLDINEELAQDEWGKITVYGGTFVNFDPANHTNDGAYYTNKLATNTCLKTEASANDDNINYTVVAHHTFVDNKCECGASQTETWELVTDVSQIHVGDIIIFVYEDGTLKYEMKSIENNIGKYAAYTTIPAGLMEFEVVSGTNGFAFKNGTSYLAAVNDNNVTTSTSIKEDSSWWTITIKDGKAVVTNVSFTERILQFNKNSGQERFCCYKNTQESISIYVKTSKVVCAKCVMKTVDHKDASCGVAGYTLERCSVCGKEERTEHEALTHDYTGANPYICVNGCGVHNLPEAGSTITIQQALWIAETLENGKETSNKYVITGVIDDKDHPSSTGATIITADGKSIYITNIYNADGTVRHDAFTVKLQHGNEITVSAKIAKNSSGEAQLHETRLNTHTDTNPADHTCDICGAENVTEHIDSNDDGNCDNGCGLPVENEPVNPETPTTPTWTLVTDASTLKVGDKIVIVAKDYAYALSTTQNKNNRGQASFTKNGNTVTFGDDVQKLTLEAGTVDGTFAFNTGSGYLYAASSSDNYLKTQTTNNANGSWKITIAADGTATIVANGTNTRNTMQYNQSSSLFACYASASQKAIVIYKLSETTSSGSNSDSEDGNNGGSEGGGVTKPTTYSYTFTSKLFSANGTKTLNGVSWTLAGNGNYWGYDGTKGQQFGSGNAPYKSMTLTSTSFSNVSKIKINTSGASSISGTCKVYVGNTLVKTITLTATAENYTIDVSNLSGEIKLEYTQTTSKALYVQSIEVTYAE